MTSKMNLEIQPKMTTTENDSESQLMLTYFQWKFSIGSQYLHQFLISMRHLECRCMPLLYATII